MFVWPAENKGSVITVILKTSCCSNVAYFVEKMLCVPGMHGQSFPCILSDFNVTWMNDAFLPLHHCVPHSQSGPSGHSSDQQI